MGWAASVVSGLASAGKTLGDTAGVLFAFFAALTDGRMWRSLGWLFLGVVSMAFGLRLWLKTAGV